MIADLTTQAGITVAVGIIIQAIKGLVPDEWAKAIPLMALLLGVLIGAGYNLATGRDVVRGAVTGFFGGATASGLYDVVAPTNVLPSRTQMKRMLGRA
ncbi:MAG: hypothetical protein ACE5MB_06680 [Anaerolineae bacterium]